MFLTEHAVATTPTEAAVAEHVGNEAGEAGIGADGSTEIVAAASCLAVSPAAGLNGVQQGLEIGIVGLHPDRGTGMVQSGDPVAEAQVSPGIEGMPVGVMGGNPVQQGDGVMVPVGQDVVLSGLEFRI